MAEPITSVLFAWTQMFWAGGAFPLQVLPLLHSDYPLSLPFSVFSSSHKKEEAFGIQRMKPWQSWAMAGWAGSRGSDRLSSICTFPQSSKSSYTGRDFKPEVFMACILTAFLLFAPWTASQRCMQTSKQRLNYYLSETVSSEQRHTGSTFCSCAHNPYTFNLAFGQTWSATTWPGKS